MDGRNAHRLDPAARGTADPDQMMNLPGENWTNPQDIKDKEKEFFARRETQL